MWKRKWMVRLLAALLALLVLAPAAALADVKEASVKLGVKESFTVRPEMLGLPEGTELLFKSSNAKVVSVSKDGKVTGKKTGTAKVAVGTSADGVLGVCTVKVMKAPSKVSLSSKSLILGADETRKLSVSLPKNTASRISYTSSNVGVAAVNSSGEIRAVGAGTATITARTFNGKKATCKVKVLSGSAPTVLTLTANTVVLGEKDTFSLKSVIGSGKDAAIAYSVKNSKIASVSSSGVITGKKAGTTSVTIYTYNGLSATVKVEVMKAPTKIALDVKSRLMGIGGTYLLQTTLSPAGSYGTTTFSSSNSAVATVDENGKITAVAPGTATITAKTHNGKTASCKITVSSAPEG